MEPTCFRCLSSFGKVWFDLHHSFGGDGGWARSRSSHVGHPSGRLAGLGREPVMASQPSSDGRSAAIGTDQVNIVTFGRQWWSDRAPLLPITGFPRLVLHPVADFAVLRDGREPVRMGQLPFFPRHPCLVASSDTTGQPVTGSLVHHGGSHDLLERWRILGACRAGRDWFSPSGAALGVGRNGCRTTSCGTVVRTEGPDIGTPPRRSRWVADLVMRILLFGAGWGVEPFVFSPSGEHQGGL